MKKLAIVAAVFLGVFVVGATESGITVVQEAEAGGKCIPDGKKCAGSQLQCCNKPCTNGVCRN
ncbi:MAG: hypothetical protein JNL38_18860 [Myxococcales bacterium]|jgi:hypothetical protein|nr:hypothetical protein [Myxococcales bacterium]